MKTLCVFDLDGTLLDTIGDLGTSCNLALKQLGYPFGYTVEEYKYMVGNGTRVLCERMLKNQNPTAKQVDALYEAFKEQYAIHAMDETKPYPGIVQMLCDLQKQGVKCAVLSNKPHAFTTQLIAKYFAKDVFACVYGQRDNIPRKPDPQALLALMQELDEPSGQVLYIGDSGVDMQTGKNAGVYTIGVSWGFRQKEELWKNGADAVVDTPTEILQFL